MSQSYRLLKIIYTRKNITSFLNNILQKCFCEILQQFIANFGNKIDFMSLQPILINFYLIVFHHSRKGGRGGVRKQYTWERNIITLLLIKGDSWSGERIAGLTQPRSPGFNIGNKDKYIYPWRRLGLTNKSIKVIAVPYWSVISQGVQQTFSTKSKDKLTKFIKALLITANIISSHLLYQ